MGLDDLIVAWESNFNRAKFEINNTSKSCNPWELSPNRLFDYIMTLSRYKFSSYMHFKSPVRFKTILENWINNFSDSDKFTAFKLSSRVLFITAHEIEYLQRYVYKKFISQYGLGMKNFLEEFLFVPLEEDVKVAEFFTLNEIPGRKDTYKGVRNFINSIDELVIPVKKIEKISVDIEQVKLSNIENKDEIIDRMVQSKIRHAADMQMKIKEYEQKKYLILLVDFSGSGVTVISDLIRILKIYSFEIVFLFSYIICEDSLNELLKISKQNGDRLKIIYGLLLTSKVKCLKENNIIFSKSDISDIRILCDKYFAQLKEHPDVKKWGEDIKYGYKDTQIILVLCRNCPNNTLPLIWAENDNWKALFPRTASYVKHSTGGKGQK